MGDEGSILRNCWLEKKSYEWKDACSKERERYYNRNRLDINAQKELRSNGYNLEEEIINKERDYRGNGRIVEF